MSAGGSSLPWSEDGRQDACVGDGATDGESLVLMIPAVKVPSDLRSIPSDVLEVSLGMRHGTALPPQAPPSAAVRLPLSPVELPYARRHHKPPPSAPPRLPPPPFTPLPDLNNAPPPTTHARPMCATATASSWLRCRCTCRAWCQTSTPPWCRRSRGPPPRCLQRSRHPITAKCLSSRWRCSWRSATTASELCLLYLVCKRCCLRGW